MEADSEIDYKIIGKRIKESRKNLKITQEILAEKVEVAVPYISRIERGEAKVNLKMLMRIAKVLNVDTRYLIDGAVETSEVYLEKEFSELLRGCEPKKRRLLYNIAKILLNVDFK